MSVQSGHEGDTIPERDSSECLTVLSKDSAATLCYLIITFTVCIF